MASCGTCVIPSRPRQKVCGLAKPYETCGGCSEDGYPLGACVSICQEIDGYNLEVFYVSLQNDNKTHPITGAWSSMTICDIMSAATAEVDVCSLLGALPDNNNSIGA